MPVTRRGLLAAGAVGGLALAGCGAPDDEPPPDAELLAPSLAAALALVDAYERIGGRLGRELGARERDQRDAPGAEERAPRQSPRGLYHQTVESRFSISSTGRV